MYYLLICHRKLGVTGASLKLLKMAQKSCTRKRLGEEGSNLTNEVKVTSLKCLLLNLFTNKMEINSYMLHPTMKNQY